MRIAAIAVKELKCVKEDLSFNLATLVSPLLFLLAFFLMLSSGILIPAQVWPGTDSSAFLRSMEDFRAPDGTAYLELRPAEENVPPTNAESNLIAVEQEPEANGGLITGRIIHYLNDVNENMTKNFRNRLSGAIVDYIEELRPGGNVLVNELTMYAQDIPWDTGFGVSVLVFGLMLSGLVFGMLSITGEWANHTAALLKLSPGASGALLAGKLLANMLKCCVSGAAFLAVFFAISGALPVHALCFVCSALLVCCIFACLGMCLGIYVKSSLTAFLISLVSALVLWVGGGGFGPLSYFGDAANALGRLNPATYAIEIVRWCYFNGKTQLAAGFAALMAALLLSAAAIAAVYARWIRKEGA